MNIRLCITIVLTAALSTVGSTEISAQVTTDGGVAIALQVVPVLPTKLLSGKHVYSATFVCGQIPATATNPVEPPPGFPLGPGTYRTAITVHNPNPFPIVFQKKAVEAAPQSEPRKQPGAAVTDRLGPGQALEVDCADIVGHLLPGPCADCVVIAPQFVNGFVAISNVREATGQIFGEPPAYVTKSIDKMTPK